MSQQAEQIELQISPQGEMLLPENLRQALGLQTGMTLIARIENGQLILETRENILTRLRDRFSAVPNHISMVNQLIAERRQAALQEQQELS